MAEKVQKLMVSKGAVRIVVLEKLQVDPCYQREVKPKHKRIVADFNEDALGLPLVGEREDGSLWIVDGQQRVTALRKLGRDKVRADVFASRGPEHEAEVFRLVNQNRTKLDALELFRAMLVAGDEGAWAVKEAVESVGYRVGDKSGGKADHKDQGPSQLSCVTVLQDVYDHHGVEPIKFALRTIKASWPDDRLGVYNTMISGMCSFYTTLDGVVDESRLVDRLRTTEPQKVLYAANMVRDAVTSKAAAVREILTKVYKKRASSRRGS